jgi:regulatory protein YycI of two-component signal transduction system YycFG
VEIFIAILIIVVILIIYLLFKKKKVNIIVEENKQESNLNEADVNMMRNINAGGFTAKKVESSNIVAPDFKKGEPIGYKDTSHVFNNTGDHIANNANQNKKI